MNSRLLPTRLVGWLESSRLLQVSTAALFRILGWFVATIIVLSAAIGDVDFAPYSSYNSGLDSSMVRDLGAQRGDERGFGDPADDDYFRIAWVAGSSVQGVEPGDRTFLPDEIAKVLPMVDDRPVAVDMYFLSGMRVLDEYAAVLTALEDEPDMIVVTLNPIWALNDRAIQGWDNLDGRLVEFLWNDPSRWGLLASLASPSDALWALSNRLSIFEDRYHWGLRWTDQFAGSSLLELGPPPEDQGEPSELEVIAAMQIPIFFWDAYSSIIGDDVTGADRQAVVFEYVIDSDSRLNELAVAGILEAVDEAGIPAYVYVAQFEKQALEVAAVDEAFDRVEARLAEFGEPHRNSLSLTYRPESLVRMVDGLEFRDPIHIFDVTPVRDYLLVELCAVVARSGWSSSCQEAP